MKSGFSLLKHTSPALNTLKQAGYGFKHSGLLKLPSLPQTAIIVWRTLGMGRSIATLAMLSAVRFPNVPAVIDEKGSLSFAELDGRAQAIASALQQEYGLKQGNSVALLCRNHRGFVEAFVAAMRLGLHVVLLNTDFPGPQLQQVLQRHELSLLIHDEEFTDIIRQAQFNGKMVVAWQDNPDTAHITLDQLAQHQITALPRVSKSGQIILLTSGTTGTPKGAPRSPNPLGFIGPALTIMAKIPFKAHQPVFVAPPLFHGFGLAFMATCLAMGAPLVIQRRFIVADIYQILHEHQVKMMVAVPAMLQRLLNVPKEQQQDLSSLTAVLAAAAPLSAALASQWMNRHGEHLFNLYGSSETGFCSIATPKQLQAAQGTVGVPPLGTQVKIFNASGQELPAMQTGHICIKSLMVFEGYVGGGKKDSIQGFMNTGDVGHFDQQGHLFIDGREDDMIVSGGENVYPQEIEELLAKHPDVLDVAVIGVADDEFGQRLRAFIVTRQTGQTGEDNLRQFIRSHVARYKMPRDFIFIEELPRNITGKILKKSLVHD